MCKESKLILGGLLESNFMRNKKALKFHSSYLYSLHGQENNKAICQNE